MNLVQLQDDLRMLPLPLLDAKAKGQDPNTPPWLAAAVLNERISAQQKAGMAQGAAQGKQPSVAEQLQQKAGLMSLQARQQQQAQQQMMQQMAQAPQPAPEGVPQPERQPEPEMMARGGLARLPINPRMFNYKEGGIIGFAGGGDANAALREFLKSIGTSASEFANADAMTRNRILEAFKNATMGPQAGPAVAPSAVPATAGGSYAAQPAPRGLQALRAMLRPGPAAALGAGAALSYGAAQALENMSPEQRAMLENAGGGDDTAMAAAILNAAKPTQQPAPPTSPRPVMANDPRMPLQYKEIPGYKPASSVSPELEEILRQEWIKEGGDPNNFRINLQTKGGVQATPEMFGLSSLRQNVAQPAPQAAPIAQQVSAPQADTTTQEAPTIPPAVTQQPAGSPAYDYSKALQDAIKRAQDEQGVTPEQARARFEATQSDILKEQAGLGQLARLKQQQQQYEKGIAERPMENWMRGLAAAARGGIGGFGTAYLESAEQNRAADAAQAKYQNDVMTAVESAQRGEATAQQKALLDMINKGEENKAKAISDQMTGAVHGYSTSQTAQTAAAQRLSEERRAAMRDITDKRGQDLHLEAARLTAQIGEAKADKAMQQQQLNELKALAAGFQAELKEPVDLDLKPEEKAARKRRNAILQQDYDAVRAAIAKLSGGVSLQSGTTAPTQRMRFDAKGNPIP